MKRVIYSMKDITKLLNITETTIRNYEKKGLISIERSENNYRQFTLKNLTRLVSIRKYYRFGCSFEMIKTLLNCKDSQSMIELLNLQKQNLQKQIADLEYTIRMINADIHRAELIKNNINDRSFIRLPDFRFYSVDELDIHKKNIKNVNISNYAFMFTPKDLYNNAPPHLGYLKLNSTTTTDQLCMYKIYKVGKNITASTGRRILYNDDLVYLEQNGYEICGNVIAIKIFSISDEQNDPADYIEAYFPVRKKKSKK